MRIRFDREIDPDSIEGITWGWLRSEYRRDLSFLVVKTMAHLYGHRALRAAGMCPNQVAAHNSNAHAYFQSLLSDQFLQQEVIEPREPSNVEISAEPMKASSDQEPGLDPETEPDLDLDVIAPDFGDLPQ